MLEGDAKNSQKCKLKCDNDKETQNWFGDGSFDDHDITQNPTKVALFDRSESTRSKSGDGEDPPRSSDVWWELDWRRLRKSDDSFASNENSRVSKRSVKSIGV